MLKLRNKIQNIKNTKGKSRKNINNTDANQ